MFFSFVGEITHVSLYQYYFNDNPEEQTITCDVVSVFGDINYVRNYITLPGCVLKQLHSSSSGADFWNISVWQSVPARKTSKVRQSKH